MFFGWGTKTKSWPLGNGYTLVCAYKYFHIWWILRFVTQKRWFLQGDKRSDDREVTAEQLKQLMGDKVPRINAYN